MDPIHEVDRIVFPLVFLEPLVVLDERLLDRPIRVLARRQGRFLVHIVQPFQKIRHSRHRVGHPKGLFHVGHHILDS